MWDHPGKKQVAQLQRRTSGRYRTYWNTHPEWSMETWMLQVLLDPGSSNPVGANSHPLVHADMTWGWWSAVSQERLWTPSVCHPEPLSEFSLTSLAPWIPVTSGSFDLGHRQSSIVKSGCNWCGLCRAVILGLVPCDMNNLWLLNRAFLFFQAQGHGTHLRFSLFCKWVSLVERKFGNPQQEHSKQYAEQLHFTLKNIQCLLFQLYRE